MTGVVGILLAAGSAQRFAGNKLLAALPDGVPVGVAAARALVAGVPEAIAVVRPGDRALADALAGAGLRVVENPLAGLGMGGSLAAGVRASADAAGWLVALADMPWVRADTVRGLADALRDGASMVAPQHAGRRGHPVGFAACWGGQLQALHGDQGARGLITDHPGALVLQPTDDPGVLGDVDRPADLQKDDPRKANQRGAGGEAG